MEQTSEFGVDEPRWHAMLSRDEMRELLEMHDLRSWFSLAVDWGLIAAAMALVAQRPGFVTIVLALAVIGARQLGLAVLMHEASHRSLFHNRVVNDFVGQWLCAYPVWSDLEGYRRVHLQHHAWTGTDKDPDLGLITPFPITPASLRRKIWRDLSGQTGRKFARAAWKRTAGRWSVDPGARRAMVGFATTNLVLLAILTALGHPALWLLWALAWLTTNTLVTRIRAIAEHALTPQHLPEPRGKTRTTIARWWERFLVAPNMVNYHLEHHLLMMVPHYNLPRMHRLLDERGLLEGACIDIGYPVILRRAAQRSSAPTPGEARDRPPVDLPPF